jgi:hypothetical protein
MAMKPELPSALDELDQPRGERLDLKSLQSRGDIPDSVIDQNSRSMGEQWKASTRLPETEQHAPIAKLRVDIPEYVFKQLKRKAFEEGGTQPYYILKGLAAIGFEVNAEDLILDRRKRGQK